jgi:hypothetical protein
MKKWIV